MTLLQYNIHLSGTAPLLFPTELFFGLLYYSREEALEIPKRYPYCGEWGQPSSIHLLEQETFPIPQLIDIVWLSIIERKFYSLVEKLPVNVMVELFAKSDKESGTEIFDHIVIGMAPYGGVAVWVYGVKKSVLVAWMQAEEIQVKMKDFMPLNPIMKLDENCAFYINNDPQVKEKLKKDGLPSRHLFDNYMKQFTYRYLCLFEKWDEDGEKWVQYEKGEVKFEFEDIEDSLYDGTHDKLHDGGLLKYHQAGKPKKLRVQWHIGKSEYSAYFWFEDERIREVFDRFYGAHPDTKTDFIIRIDAEKRKYELALYRYGLKEPQIIPEDVYQLIVFKNKFEDYRSENYNQERGAWIW